jgi:hypothetical protein
MEVTTLLQNLSRWCYLNVCFVPKADVQYYYLKNLSLKLEANKYMRTD